MTRSTYFVDVVSGNAPSGAKVVHKFGRNDAVGTTFASVAMGGIWRTPQVAGATTLRVKAGGDVADTAAGAGARSIVLEGIDSTGAYATETLVTAGVSASASTSTSWLRIFRAYVGTSGTYSVVVANSHADVITIENTAGTEDWVIIDANGVARAQSEIAAYTVPTGKTAYLMDIHYAVDTTKTTGIILFQRAGILRASAPYTAARELLVLSGIASSGTQTFEIPLGPFKEHTDIWVMANVSATTSEIGVGFEILLKDKE